jgi:hypothetical protein
VTGPEQFREAERLLSEASFVASPDDPRPCTRGGNEMRPDVHHGLVGRALAHATLALAAATALNGGSGNAGLTCWDYDAWESVAGTKRLTASVETTEDEATHDDAIAKG